jgi:RNA polymerase sigma-70 factor (ECF subfamily)
MTGSALDGEDVVQETLFQAYRHLDEYDERRSMGPWLMGIAHNRCLDLLRRRKVRIGIEGDSSALRSLPRLPKATHACTCLRRSRG